MRTALADITIASTDEKLENIQIQTLGADGIVLRTMQIDQDTINAIIAQAEYSLQRCDAEHGR